MPGSTLAQAARCWSTTRRARRLAVAASGAVTRISTYAVGCPMPESDVGSVEVLEAAAGRRPTLALVVRAVGRRTVRVLGRRREPEEGELTDLHARPQHDRQGGDVRELQRDVAGEPRVDEAGGRMGQQAEAPQARLALDPGGEVVGKRDRLERAAEHELSRMQHEALAGVHLDEAGEVGLVLGRVD